jgi:hypothetical protein
VIGVLMQYFINMEVERYTLATGETTVAGFIRMWKPLGLVMCACAIVPNMWPAWATSSSTVLTFLTGGGGVNAIAICALLAIDRFATRVILGLAVWAALVGLAAAGGLLGA